MSPIDQLLANDWTLPAVAVCFIALVFWVRRQVRTYNVSTSPPRPDRRLPRADYWLLGDDYRDRVAPFFNRRLESDERVAHAIHHACFTKKEAPARVESPGATTPSKELTHARSADK